MSKRVTTSDFIKKAIDVHGYKYDYSKVVYKKAIEKVEIICPIHGSFMQDPHHHIASKNGCPLCGDSRSKTAICGVGINDVKGLQNTTVYNIWRKMIERCYSTHKYADKRKDRKKAFLCEEWKRLSNFKKWFDKNYVEGYQLDKDILSKNNKIYSPETCCFVPQSINTLIIKNDARRGKYPIGVSFDKKNKKFVAQMSKGGQHVRIGWFNTIEETFAAYKKAKEDYIKEVAITLFNEGKIKENVCKALMDYKVLITH